MSRARALQANLSQLRDWLTRLLLTAQSAFEREREIGSQGFWPRDTKESQSSWWISIIICWNPITHCNIRMLKVHHMVYDGNHNVMESHQIDLLIEDRYSGFMRWNYVNKSAYDGSASYGRFPSYDVFPSFHKKSKSMSVLTHLREFKDICGLHRLADLDQHGLNHTVP